MPIYLILKIVFIIYCLICLWIFLNQKNIVYLPVKEILHTPAHVNLSYENLNLEVENGEKINAWYLPKKEAIGTILFCHGNAGNIGDRTESILIFHNLNLNVLIFDYRGFGQSDGSASEIGSYKDADRALQFLQEEKQLTNDKLIIFGRSLGGGVATHLATNHKASLFIIESSFKSVPHLAAYRYPLLPVKYLARIRYPSIDNIKKITCPVLVLHSKEDEVIPFSHGQQLFETANEPKEFQEINGMHGEGFLETGEKYTNFLKMFIEKYHSK